MTLIDQSARGAAFPLEIFGRILDCLAERQFEVPLEKSQIESLRACSLASRQLTQYCQRLLLERLEGIYFNGPKTLPLKRLEELFNESPRQLRAVRELALIHALERSDSANSLILLPGDLLLKFPCLASLKITLDRPRITLKPLCRSIISTYTAQHTLHSLTLEDIMEDTFWPLILNSQSLQHLTLNYSLLRPCTSDVRNKSITRLSLNGIRITAGNISLMAPLTRLEILDLRDVSISGVQVLGNIDNFPPWVPPGRLREINAMSDAGRGEIILLESLVFNLQRFQPRNVYLLQLSTLRFPIHSGQDTGILELVRPYAPALQHIEITVTENRPSRQGIVREINQAIATSNCMPSGVTLVFDISYKGWYTNKAYDTLMEDIISLVGTLSRPNNTLAKFSVMISMRFTDWGPLHLELNKWGLIASKLGTKNSFPALQRVEVRVVGRVSADIKSVVLQRFGGEMEVQDTLLKAMLVLHEREDVELDTKFSFVI